MSKVKIEGNASGTGTLTIAAPNTDTDSTLNLPDGAGDLIYQDSSGNVTYTAPLAFTDGTERMRIDSSGNLLVGTTANNLYATSTETGCQLSDGYMAAAREGTVAYFNRITSDGDIVQFRRDGSTVGSIGVFSGVYLAEPSGAAGIRIWAGGAWLPVNADGSNSDNDQDLGHPSIRFDDIYATNGTIQTSDRNEKQDIEELSEAEQRVAVACKGLMRKYRWKDAVAEKGDDARIHFGIIAQDLQDAFAAEGLDAGRYAMFISSTWWEAEETYTDDDGVEQTRTNTYETAEEAPEGAVERTRLGVRYPELLAFIIAAI